MIIQHNLPAINAHRQLGVNNSTLSKNLEKLSSGYRINRAADDAAGLAISEKMRAQVTGLNRAVLNAQDGTSLIQTAEGGLQEVHSMLNRMVELATQSANGTIQADDRQKIEAEVEALKGEIDRISQATNFNGIKLLDGSLGANNVNNMSISGLAPSATSTAAAVNAQYTLTFAAPTVAIGDKVTYTMALEDGASHAFEFTVNGDGNLMAKDGTVYTKAAAAMAAGDVAKAVAGEANKVGSLSSKFNVSASATGVVTFEARVGGTSGAKVVASGGIVAGAVSNPVLAKVADTGLDEAKAYTVAAFTGNNLETAAFTVNGVKFVAATAANAKLITDKSINVIVVSNNALTAADYGVVGDAVSRKTGVKVDNLDQAGDPKAELVFHGSSNKGLSLQVGDTADAYNKITVKVDNLDSTGLGLTNVSVANPDSADAALTTVKAAIEKVSINRGNLGALQNRLEHTINNLNVSSENMTAAESRIRDVDMAKEMMNFTKNNVLAQAAQAMLAQANQQPQQVLQLLR